MSTLYSHSRYTLRSKFFRLFGGAYTLYDDTGQALGFAQMKRFRLKEDIRLFADAGHHEPLLSIRTHSVFDFSGAYDVADAEGRRIGTLKRSGLKSTFMRDHWQMLTPEGEVYAELVEDSQAKAMLRRLAGMTEILSWLNVLLPQRYDLDRHGRRLVHYQQRFNPFIYKLDVAVATPQPPDLDNRLVLAMAVLLAAIEGRQ
ncbi:hypothetical protein [Salinisphaera sp. Q1T1-3]|uniref:hypothetical protein n=1 Tax=Salinisphaera sp. Q1T1-3 TaxID=2321229 RepID=UPI000E7445B9|nr:hypothetical protein [Salinisphaera sp. Q1T1-3]RJS92841.1 hypothetical protein D3260_09790 [Salinisphaera sp. Q1T1-3]